MKKCLSCEMLYSVALTNCQHCTWAPAVIDNFPVYAPDLAKNNTGFNPEHFAELAKLEANNFWFRARNRLIINALQQYAPNFKHLLEIGCGTGYVLSGIAEQFPDRSYTGGEIYVEGLSHAAARQKIAMEFLQMDAQQMPFVNEFDCIGAFDVLEHINDDTQVLLQIHQALTADGTLLLTVPQHQWLWSNTDAMACHVRRYSAADLHKKVVDAGFKIIRSTSFVTTLLPFLIASRFLKKKPTEQSELYAELRLPHLLNSFFEKMLNLEASAIQKGMNLPIGSSRLLVCKKA